uniref:GRIP domain-containing protein n=1 Tax=Hyaloperonospora arabidopsidis (strain Emoy2) TaxID=559515 RepID=M4BCP4_HYAAE
MHVCLLQYLKNVIIKYIGSQVPGEKEQLVPVIATLLSFSPQEHHQVRAAHSKANAEGTNLFGGVFSLFGGGGASAPPPKPLAALHNVKPSPRSAKSKTTGVALGSKDKNGVLLFGSDPSDDEESLTLLNPFTA